MNLGDLVTRAAAKFPRQIALTQGDGSFTYAELNERVNRLASSLLGMGLQKGDRVGVLLKNCHQFIEIYFACAKIGAVFCPYNHLLPPDEIRGLLVYCDPRVVFSEGDFEWYLPELIAELDMIEACVMLDPADWPRARYYPDLLDTGGDGEPNANVEPGEVMSIFFTAGVTGLPKGVVRSHHHVLTTAVTGLIENRISYGERTLMITPMFQAAFEDHIGRCFYVPNTTVIYDQPFEPQAVLRLLGDERITNCLLTPAMIKALIKGPGLEHADLRELRRVFYMGPALPRELLRQALEAFGNFGVGLCQQYGLTEAGPMVSILPPEDHMLEGPEFLVKRSGSAGRPVLDCEVCILDEGDNLALPGEVGEIAVHSEAMMLGYWRLEQQTEAKMFRGWLRTGDLGYLDEDGYLFVVGRKDDLIVSGGKNIHPREVEDRLYEHPAVQEAAVVGVPDETWGQTVMAVVALKPGAKASEGELMDFCGRKLAGYQKPKGLEFWEELPKSAAGDLLRRKVREQCLKEAARGA